MIISYWCPDCRCLHPVAALRIAAGEPVRCAKTGGAVHPRGIPDDPDDPNYRQPRCHVCQWGLEDATKSCPECGAEPVED